MILRANRRRRVALYVRVSTEEQRERQTIETQLRLLRHLADRPDELIEIVAVLRDDGISGRLPLNKRSATGGQQLIQLVEAGAVDEVWFTKLDRIARRLRVLLDIHDFLQSHHVSMFADAEKVDTSTPTGELVFHVLGAIAHWETSTIAERSRNGKLTKAPLGNYNGGVIAFGYAIDDEGNGTIDDTKLDCGYKPSELVPLIIERIAAGGSASGQARWLNEMGVPSTQRYANYTKVLRTGWTAGRVIDMVHNSAYSGDGIWKGHGGDEPTPYRWPALISRTKQDEALAQLTKNKLQARRHAKRDYLLGGGLIKCGDCGSTYAGRGSTGRQSKGPARYFYYGCRGTKGIHQNGGHACNAKLLPAKDIDQHVWALVAEQIRNPGRYAERGRRQLEEQARADQPVAEEMATIGKQLAALCAENERVLRSYDEGLRDLEQTRARQSEIRDREAVLRRRLGDLEDSEGRRAAEEASFVRAMSALEECQAQLDDIEATDDFEAKQDLVRKFIRGITVTTTGAGHAKQAEVTIRMVADQASKLAVFADSSVQTFVYQFQWTTRSRVA